ncbi:MAG TPA: hypothetical protein VFK66_05765 [Oryzihumus sp.]|nr:hypothetical protein [Oryzihumus sp.]
MAAAPSDPDLNSLFAAALEFGPSWRRPVGDLAAELFPNRRQDDRDVLAAAVDECRSAIEADIAATHMRLAGQWARRDEQQTDQWIANRYPWMTKKNRRRALSQGQYYAWHDHG